jgi:hypothetical protein
MTASPVDSAEPGPRFIAWPAAFALTIWIVFSGTIVSVYLMAFNRHVPACERAAAWSLSISLAVGILAFLAAPEQYGRLRSRHRRQAAEPGLAVTATLLLLVAGSVAVIWLAVNLTLAKQPAGAWILTLPAVAAAIAGPASGVRVRPLRPADTSPGPAGPATVLVEPGAGASQLLVEPLPGPGDTPSPPTGSHDDLGIGVLPPPGPEIASRDGLLNHALLAEHEGSLPAVALDAGFWRAATSTLNERGTEQGGVALISRHNGALLVIGAVFPAQVGASYAHCEFSTTDIERVRLALDRVADEIGIGPGDLSITWVHTHPNLGVFLSGTDKKTSRNWRALDPDFTPIVIDISRPTLTEQIGVFDGNEREITPMRVVEGLVLDPMASRLGRAIVGTYHADGQPPPLVLLSGFHEGRGHDRNT